MIEGIVALGAFGAFAIYKMNGKKREKKRFTDFIERATFENILFVKKEELGYQVSYFKEDKYSIEMWEKDGHFRLFVKDDEIKKPIFIIEKNEQGLTIQHPTIFYYRTAFEEKRGLFQAFIHRYVKGDFEVVTTEQMTAEQVVPKETVITLPSDVQEKVIEIQTIYGRIMEKKEDLDIESYTLLETLIFHDLKQIIGAYGSLSKTNQEAHKGDVLEGLEDILVHLRTVEEKRANEQVRELKKSLRIVKKRGDY